MFRRATGSVQYMNAMFLMSLSESQLSQNITHCPTNKHRTEMKHTLSQLHGGPAKPVCGVIQSNNLRAEHPERPWYHVLIYIPRTPRPEELKYLA